MAKRKPQKEKAMQAAEKSAEEKAAVKVANREAAGKGSATLERLLKAGVKPDDEGFEIDPTGRQRITEAPLDRLRKDGKITRREFDAGDKYRSDAYLAAINPTSGSVDWEQAGGGGRSARVPSMYSAQHVFDARIRWRAINDRMKRGSVVATVLDLALIHEMPLSEIGINVFGVGGTKNERDARNAGLGGFRVALGALADHYEIMRRPD